MPSLFRPRLQLLDAAEPQAIFEDALLVLEKVGVRVQNPEGADLLRARGAIAAGDRLLISEGMVHTALETCPSTITLFDRDGGPAAELGGGAPHFDPGSAAIHLLDPETGARRPAATADVVELVRLVDGLPHYELQSTALLASDVPKEVGDRYRLYLALRHGRKPIVTGTFQRDGFEPMREMLQLFRRDAADLAARPPAIFDCCPSPPLEWSDLTTQSLLDCARAGLPAELVSMPLTGATSPVTLREAVVQHCAESLSGIVLHQAAQAGSPILWGGAPSAFDMRHGTTPMGAVETMMINCADAQVGRHLRLPTHGYLALSDAKCADYQAGMESGIGAILGALAGIDVISGPGILDYILTQSPEKLLLDHEACGMALRLVGGIERHEVDLSALFADLVRTGELLSHAHTRRNWRRELSLPSALIDRDTWTDWEAKGSRTAAERARTEATRRRATSPGTPPSPAKAEELARLMLGEARRYGLERLPAETR